MSYLQEIVDLIWDYLDQHDLVTYYQQGDHEYEDRSSVWEPNGLVAPPGNGFAR